MKPFLALLALASILPLTGCVTDRVVETAARPIQQPSRRDAFSADPSALDRSLHRRIDEYRRTQGLGPLAFDPNMADLARGHSEAMASAGSINNNGRSRRLAQMRQFGVPTVSEIVAVSRG